MFWSLLHSPVFEIFCISLHCLYGHWVPFCLFWSCLCIRWHSYILGTSHSLSFPGICSVNQFSSFQILVNILNLLSPFTLLCCLYFFITILEGFQEVIEVNTFVSSTVLNQKSLTAFLLCFSSWNCFKLVNHAVVFFQNLKEAIPNVHFSLWSLLLEIFIFKALCVGLFMRMICQNI